FELPAVATWHVLVNRASGQGTYQLTTTIFGGPQPVCGNNSTQTGEECAGASIGDCPGSCQGNCRCTPVCGDDTCDPGETALGCPIDCGCSSAGSGPFGNPPGGAVCHRVA